MKIIKAILVASVFSLPLLAAGSEAQAATAAQYSAAGHGRKPIMTNRPGRAIYHRHMHRRRM